MKFHIGGGHSVVQLPATLPALVQRRGRAIEGLIVVKINGEGRGVPVAQMKPKAKT